MATRGTPRSPSGASTPRGRTTSRSKGSAPSAKRSASSAKRSAATKGSAARKGGQTRGRPARAADVEAKTVAEFREALRKNLIRPRDMVLLTRERIEEVLGEAVERGAVTTKDAQGIGSNLLKRGRKETNDVLKDLEGLLTKGVRRRAKDVRKQASGARRRAVRAASPALATADRARRAAGVGPNFPITGYHDLTATEIQRRLGRLTPAELRKVRDYERRNANRKTVLNAIEAKLK
jgi:polyhydroxyalkanoate synthesis regulator phasin